MPVGKFHLLCPHAHTTHIAPAQNPVVGDITPQHAVVLIDPNGAFTPDRASAQTLQLSALHNGTQALIENIDSFMHDAPF